MASWVIFWFDVTQLQPQISTALSIMLSTVLFSFGTDFGIARVPYLTLVDRQVLLSFLFAFFAIVSVGFLHVVQLRKGQAVAQRDQRRLRGSFRWRMSRSGPSPTACTEKLGIARAFTLPEPALQSVRFRATLHT